MRLLIGSNGTAVSDEVLGDLRLAGLPDDVTALALTVLDGVDDSHNKNGDLENAAAETANRVHRHFPNWDVTTKTIAGSPAAEMITNAERFDADLIVVNHPESGLAQIDWQTRSVAESVLGDADRSVRLIRHRRRNERPPHIVLAFDGTSGSIRAVEAIAVRRWPIGSAVHVVSVADLDVLSSIGRFVPQMIDTALEAKIVQQWGNTLAESALDRLRSTGMEVSFVVDIGNAAESVVKQANDWDADCIFVGPNGPMHTPVRHAPASVSLHIASAARCSIEVVRPGSQL